MQNERRAPLQTKTALQIGILGNGRLGPGLGAMGAKVGHHVVPATAISAAEVLLLAARPAELEPWLAAVGDLTGRTLIVPHGGQELAPDGTPLSTWLPARLPGARLVWAFGNVGWSFCGDSGIFGPREIPVCSGDAEARAQVAGLMTEGNNGTLITDLALVPR